MKFLKKAVSALLASVMCIPSGILSFASAAEEETTVTTVTLADTENGLMQFSEECMEAATASQDGYHMVQVNEDGELEQAENDGSMWAFNYGDFVEVELIPDDEYHVRSFTIINASSGDTIAYKETTDNIFSFLMPSVSVQIEAVFSASSIVEVLPENEIVKENGSEEDNSKTEQETGKLEKGQENNENRYHDITDTTVISEEEVEEAVFDLTTESYIKANLNPAYMEYDGTNEPADVLHVKQTLYDGKYVGKDETINSIMEKFESGGEDMENEFLKFLGQIDAYVFVYDYDKDSDYYVTYANTMQKDEECTVQDWAFAYNDNNGKLIDGCIYDHETGLLYIPKQIYKQMPDKFKDKDGKGYIQSMQVQFMQVYVAHGSTQGYAEADLDEVDVPDLQSDICTLNVDGESESIDVNVSNANIFKFETTTMVSPGMNPDNLIVSVNGAPINKEMYEYNPDSGELTVEISSGSIISVEAYENEKSIKEQILDIVSTDAHAYETFSYGSMTARGDTIWINDPDELPKSSDQSLYRAFKVNGELGYGPQVGGAAAGHYVTSMNGGTFPGDDASEAALMNYVLHGGTLNSSVKPTRPIGAYHIISYLSNATAASGSEWIDDKKGVDFIDFVRQLGDGHTNCAHIGKPIGVSGGGSAPFMVRAVYIHDAKEKTTTKTKNGVKTTTWTATGGYVIFAYLSTTISNQTTCEFARVNFQGRNEKREKTPDPFCFALIKDSDNKSEIKNKTPLSNSTLAGAKICIDFYEGQKFNSAKAADKAGKVTATWEFTTKIDPSLGSEDYQGFMKTIKENQGKTQFPVAGADFQPKNMYDDKKNFIKREKWKNNFIRKSDLDSWREHWGKKGTYVVYEDEAPSGFIEEGQMIDYNNKSNRTDTVWKGMAVYLEGDVDTEVSKILINGENSEGKLLSTNKRADALLYLKDEADVFDASTIASTAEAVEAGKEQHVVEADSGKIMLCDTIKYKGMETGGLTYTVTTSLYDKTAGDYVNVEWWTGNGGQVIEPAEDDEAAGTFKTASSIFHEMEKLGSNISFDGWHEFKVYGTISTDGMKDHELVFMNTIVVLSTKTYKAEFDEDDDIEDKEGFMEELTSYGSAIWQSSEDDKSEYITFKKEEPGEPDLSTSISEKVINRKGGDGVAIAPMDSPCILVDKINYSGLENGKTYTIKAWLVDAATNEKAKDSSNNDIEISEGKTAEGENGSWDIEFSFDTAGLEGKKFVSFVEVYDGDTLVLNHKDISDMQEAVIIPKLATELKDDDTQDHISAEGKVSLTDTITYENLMPSANCKIISYLVDEETGEIAKDKNGNEMKKEGTYVVDASGNGSFKIDLEFEIAVEDAKSYVAFEEIQIEKESDGSGEWVVVASHKDLEDEAQKTVVPKIKTFAVDQKTEEHISFAEKNVVIYETLHYEDFQPDTEYTVISKLVDKETGSVVVDDDNNEQILEMTFKTKEDFDAGKYGAYGDVKPNNHDDGGIVFTLNAESFAGRTLVVYEEVYKKGENGMQLIASEEDPENANQTIHFPKIRTNAIDTETQSNISLSGDGTTVIKDTISYENVIPGLTYKIAGRVIDKRKTEAAGKEVLAAGTDGKEARNFTVFTPDEPNGTEELAFDIDTSKYTDDLKTYKGAVFVVFEEMYVIQRYDGDDAESIVASHTDIDDTSQTIYIPYITTTLLDTKTGLHIMYAEKDACLTETISYYSCKPGHVFYVSGRLIDMRTGNTLVDSAGNEAKVEYQQFMASGTGDGTVDLVYNIDATALAGTTVVAYAEVYVQGGSGEGGYTPVAIHDDFFDKDERVYIPFISTTLLDQKTNSHYALAEKNIVLYDTVHYTDVLPGNYEYKFETELRDQATGEVVTDDAGRKLSLTTNFLAHFDMRDDQFATYGDVIPQNYEGSGITFEIDGEYFADRTLVCYERLYIKGADGGWHIVADHQDLMDSEQTVHLGKGWTEALDSVTKTQTGKISGHATIVDTFYYQNLRPGYTYELRGKVVEKNATIATGTDVVVAENTVSGLTPDTSSGAWHNSFTFDATKYNSEEYYGTTLVVYEELYQIKRYDGADDRELIAFEKDVNNSAQTVWYPHIETELTVSTNGTHVLSTGENRKVVDAVSYHNMQPNTPYVLSGRLVDMETGQTLTDSKGQRMEKSMNVMSSDNGDGT